MGQNCCYVEKPPAPEIILQDPKDSIYDFNFVPKWRQPEQSTSTPPHSRLQSPSTRKTTAGDSPDKSEKSPAHSQKSGAPKRKGFKRGRTIEELYGHDKEEDDHRLHKYQSQQSIDFYEERRSSLF
eukprot:Platyproteum_vivax@DN2727_c0_g1_i1.p2